MDTGRKRKWMFNRYGVILATLSGVWVTLQPAPVLADSPAITDFTASSFACPWESPHAIFLTLCADGSHHLEIHPVADDAVAGFAAEHPGWRIDEGLTWLWQVPVYVRELTTRQVQQGHDFV